MKIFNSILFLVSFISNACFSDCSCDPLHRLKYAEAVLKGHVSEATLPEDYRNEAIKAGTKLFKSNK
jgi:hypothetical protein